MFTHKLTKLLFTALTVLCIGGLLMACDEKEEENEMKEIGTENLKVTPGSLAFEASGGTKPLNISTTYKYFGLEFEADWIDYSFDENYDILHITALPNTTDKSRQAVIDIMGSNDGETILERVKVKVQQDAGSGSDMQQVSPSGGTVVKGDMTLTFSTGTFDQTTGITVSEVKSGDVLGSDEASTFYEVDMPVHTGQSMKVSIKSNEKSDDIAIVAHMPNISAHTFEPGHSDFIYETTYENGAYTATIPAFENGSNERASFAVGLAHTKTFANGVRTRTGAGVGGQVANVKWHYAIFKSEEIDKNEVLTLMDDLMEKAIKKLMATGIVKEKDGNKRIYDISVKFDERNDGDYGEYKDCLFGHTFGGIFINKNLLNGTIDTNELYQTIVHEMHHYFSTEYDKRWTKAGGGMCSPWITLTEAGGVWAEKFADNTSPSKILIGACPTFIRGFYAEDLIQGGLYESEMGKQSTWYNPFSWYWTGDRRGPAWREHGYGMSLFFDYLSQQYGDQIITDIYQAQYDGGKDPYDCIEKVVATKDPQCFSTTFFGYKHFLVDVALGLVRNGINYGNFKVDKYLFSKDETITKQDNCYRYGAIFGYSQIENSYTNASGEHSVAGKQMVIEQKKDGVTTEVYKIKLGAKKGQYDSKLMGTAVKGTPLIIADKQVLEDLMVTSVKTPDRLLFISYPTNNDAMHPSELAVSLEDADVLQGKWLYIKPNCLMKYTKTGEQAWLQDISAYEVDYTIVSTVEPSSKHNIIVTKNGNSLHVEGYCSGTNTYGMGTNQGTFSFDIDNTKNSMQNARVNNLQVSVSQKMNYNDYAIVSTYTASNIPLKTKSNNDKDFTFEATVGTGMTNFTYAETPNKLGREMINDPGNSIELIITFTSPVQ